MTHKAVERDARREGAGDDTRGEQVAKRRTGRGRRASELRLEGVSIITSPTFATLSNLTTKAQAWRQGEGGHGVP